MGNLWTDEQLEAIETTGCNLLVSAAAGAGKTAVLVERIIRLLCHEETPLDIDRLLVVTFTEAAAAEMRERISAAMEEKIAHSGRGELARQLSLVNGASISTLHSFCLDIIRRYFYLLDMDPGFRVADEREAQMLQQQVLDQLLEDAFQSGDAAFHELAHRYGGKTADEGLGRLILRLYRYTWSNPWPRQWLAEAATAFNVPEGVETEAGLEKWLPPLKEHLGLSLAHAKSSLQRAGKLCNRPGGPLAYENRLLEDLEQVENLESLVDGSWDALREAWQGLDFKRLPAVKDSDEELKEQVQALRKKGKEALSKIGKTFFERSAADFLQEIGELAPLIEALTSLVARFAGEYGQAKKMYGLLDFNDLEHHCLQILMAEDAPPGKIIPSEAAREVRARYEHVLVDEYQDINPVQDAILTLVSRQGETTPNLFMVGDVKQSIYRFRLGDPGLFLERYRRYPAEKGKKECKLLLSKNFRCRHGVVTAVNYLFRQLMTTQAAELEYDREAELVCGAHYPEPSQECKISGLVDVHLLEREQDGDHDRQGDDEGEDLDALEREATVIAGQIVALLNGPDGARSIFDKDEKAYRPVTYRDIVILLRATSNSANRLVEILARHGIPAYADLSSGYFAATEVETMLSLLQVVDNPRQDIPLAAVLRSPLVGLTVEELAAVRQAGERNDDFFDAVLAASKQQLPGLSEKLTDFLTTLERWRTLARRETLATFITAVYRESGYSDYVAGLPDGAQRQANLRALFSRARQFDRFARQGLFRFLSFIEQLRRSGEDLGTARALGEKENVVRIMSIHKSKGLEFPVVILGDLGKTFNFQDQRSEMLVHRRLGLGPLIVEPEKKLRYPSLPYLALKIMGEAETRAEEMRVLYVALTRAREQLILVGSARGLDKHLESWRQLLAHCGEQLPAAELTRARTYLDWLGRALIRHGDVEGRTETYSWQAGEESRFRLTVWDRESLSEIEVQREVEEEYTKRDAILSLQHLTVDTADDLQEEIRTRLAYKYPYARLDLPAKLSVSELKRRFSSLQEEEGEKKAFTPTSWSRPAFMQQKAGLSPAERGILYHQVLQHLDLSLSLDERGIEDQIHYLQKAGVLTEEATDYLDPGLIAAFFTSEAGRVVQKYRSEVYREWPFTLSLPAAEIATGNGDESLIIQGIIDLLVRTPQGFVVIDYKTDRLPAGGLTALAKRYEDQLRYYARAVETILSVPVCGAYLYAFAAGESVRVF
ncbi:helicase-exonuclease AddAB subunit AddA [Dethiobacter alkaliphilus]|uniref:helicase-exonuclease AddAB subunit AddA n=1 Tax=Dethiobacter alkaliphilus TaxID=427926 RepID=UPI002227ECEA|nr:helicase-exonuclease AddAB subunit AddA [Dethiobacter alkaliphilus]MCW3489659.1 helicase-exonuclease AddAB subunit AddA [Dethiobacter alkaliphilus]